MISKPIAKLIDIQVREELTDKEMADQLGCSRQLWQMTRTEETPLSMTMLKCVCKNFPDLNQDVIYFFTGNGDKSSNDAVKNPLRQPSEAQGRGLKRFFVGLLGRIRNRGKG